MIRYSVFVLLLTTTVVEARPVRRLPYEQLYKEADVVVVASAMTERDFENKDETEYHVTVPIITSLEVHLVLKGEVKSKVAEFVHYRRQKGQVVLGNAPDFIRFEMSGPRGGIGLRHMRQYTGNPSKYILFLKRRADGRLEAVTDPDPLYSVKKLVPPDRAAP